MKNLLVVLSFLSSVNCFAGTFGRYGVGVFGSAERSRTETKVFTLGYEEQIFGPFIKQYEIGVWADSAGHGRSSSGFGNVSIGIETAPGYFVLRSLWGIGANNNTRFHARGMVPVQSGPVCGCPGQPREHDRVEL